MTRVPEKTIQQLEAELAACRAELEKSRADIFMIDNMIETSIDPITVLDSDGRIVRANPAFLELLGCSAEDIMQKEPLLLEKGEQAEVILFDLA